MSSKNTTLSIDDATPEQIAGRIASLRAKLSSVPEATALRDADIQRFLIARQYDLDKSLLMLQNYFTWKKELKIDEIPLSNGSTVPYLISTRKLHGIPDSNYDPTLPGVREDFAKFYPATGGGCYHGYDKQGRPLYIDRLGAFEVRQFAETCSPETFRDFFIRNFEFMFKSVVPEAVKATGKPVEQLSVIMDCTGMGLRQFHIPVS
jgi:hypothetical protein